MSFDKKRIKKLVGWGIAAVLVWLIVRHFRNHPQIFDALENLKPIHILWALGLDVLVVCFYALRTYVVIRRMTGVRFGFLSWLVISANGQFLNYFLSQSGDVYRALAAKKLCHLKYSDYAACVSLVSWLDMALIFTMALLLRAFMAGDATDSLPLSSAFWVWLAWIAFAPVGTFVVRSCAKMPIFPQVVATQTHMMLQSFWRRAADWPLMAGLSVLGTLHFSLMAGIVFVIFSALGAPVAAFQATFILAAFKLSKAILITPGNLGVHEWSVSGVCLVMGLDPGIGLLYAMIMRAVRIFTIATTASLLNTPRAARWIYNLLKREQLPVDDKEQRTP